MNQTRLLVGFVVIVIGIGFLVGFNAIRYLFPLFIIWVGYRILTGKNDFYYGDGKKGTTREDKIDRVLVFSGINKSFTSSNFKGADIVAVFGGGDVDLSSVSTNERELKLSFVTVFGGLKIKVPNNWNVKSDGLGILGGFDNNTKASSKSSLPVKIEGVAIFGGIEIVN